MFKSAVVKSAFICAAALFLTAGSVSAKTAPEFTGYECSIKASQAGMGWIAPTIIFAMQGDRVAVIDGIVHAKNNGKPVEATVVEQTDKKLVLRWELALSNRGQSTIMRYRAVLFHETGKITVDARPAGYDNKLQDRGTCQRITAKPGKKSKG
ncbi:hypothetical protein [Gemmobacter serpentinus]|uniref:hypothetical protein n=1 Tax=Gemmobacter serpentinus TaxID=2652247 RepID=UPI00186582F7|nr:hypothetical protein [Gemmobacter serpentinus]